MAASGDFLVEHFGFQRQFASDDVASLAREDAGLAVVLLRRGVEVLPEDQRHERAAGLILAFTVVDLEGELARQVRDPNGVIVQLPDWNGVR